MAPKSEVIIDIPSEKKITDPIKEKFTLEEEKPGEKTPLLGKKKETKLQEKKPKGVLNDPAIIGLFLFLVTGTSVGFYLLCHEDREPLSFQVPLHLIERPDVLSSPPYKLFPLQTMSELIIAVDEVPKCATKDQCLNVIKANTLPYNFLVGGDGNVYEVLGWNFLSDISESHNREKAFILGFTGDFSKETAPVNCLGLIKAFASEAIRRKRLVSDYKVFGLKNVSRAIEATQADKTSEAFLFKDFLVWPNWSGVIETV